MIEFFGLSETGPIREENQDAILLPNGISLPGSAEAQMLFALADGMGGYAQGATASRLALQTLLDICSSHSNHSIPATLKRAVWAANLAVVNEASRLGVARMGSTLTVACLDDARLHLAHIGDSRAYLVRPGCDTATCLTQDHTVVGDLLRMRVIAPHQVRTHARRSILTRAVGLDLFVQPDILTIDLHPGDRFVLCSDGVWAVIEDEEFAQIALSAVDLPGLCRRLLDLALARGSDDNVSVIAVHIQEFPANDGYYASNGRHKTKPARQNGSAGWLQRILKRRI